MTDAKNKFTEVVDRISNTQEHCLVTLDGQPYVVVVPYSVWESIQETLAVFSDPAAMDDLYASSQSAHHNPGYTIEDAQAVLTKRKTLN